MLRITPKVKTIITVLACAAVFAISPFTKEARAANQAPQSATIDSDGDDERTELLYHWQDKRFSDEERHQIISCGLLVAIIVFTGAARRRQKRRQYEK